jgi:hypothetical protein
MKISTGTLRVMIFVVILVALGSIPFIREYLMEDAPSPVQACISKCAQDGKNGSLVYKGPATPKELYKLTHSECECR